MVIPLLPPGVPWMSFVSLNNFTCAVNWLDRLVCERGRKCRSVGKLGVLNVAIQGKLKETLGLLPVCSKLGMRHQLVSVWGPF